MLGAVFAPFLILRFTCASAITGIPNSNVSAFIALLTAPTRSVSPLVRFRTFSSCK